MLPTPGGGSVRARQHDCGLTVRGPARWVGIVSKRLGSRYRSGRSPDWLKFKNPEAPAVRNAHQAERRARRGHVRWWVREPAPVSRSAQIHFRELPYRFGARPKTRVLLLCRPRGRWMEAPRPDAGDARPRLATNARPRRVDDQAHHSSCDCPVGHARGLTPPSWTPARAAPCEQFYADRRRELAQGSANHRLRQ